MVDYRHLQVYLQWSRGWLSPAAPPLGIALKTSLRGLFSALQCNSIFGLLLVICELFAGAGGRGWAAFTGVHGRASFKPVACVRMCKANQSKIGVYERVRGWSSVARESGD